MAEGRGGEKGGVGERMGGGREGWGEVGEGRSGEKGGVARREEWQEGRSGEKGGVGEWRGGGKGIQPHVCTCTSVEENKCAAPPPPVV